MNAARSVPASNSAMMMVTMAPDSRTACGSSSVIKAAGASSTSHSSKLSPRSRMMIQTDVCRIGLAFWQ